MATIEDLLKTLQYNVNNSKIALENTAETWKRISSKSDSFSELGLTSTELEQFLSEWCANNPYSNIK